MKFASLSVLGASLCFALVGCVSTESDTDSTEDELRWRRLSKPAATVSGSPTLHVTNGELFDRCGEKVLLRGVNKDVVALDREGNSMAEIAKTGANAVRMVWLASVNPAEFELPVSRAVSSGLIPILELHDATGNIWRVPEMVNYWTRPDTVKLVQKYQGDLIINIANEAGDHQVGDDTFIKTYTDAVTRMRNAGIHTPLIIDAARWGQDVEQLLRVGARVFDSDPDKNLIFSWHEYSGGSAENARITNAFEAARKARLPLIVGEFAQVAWDCQWTVPYWHILNEANRLGVGWLAWSWDNTNGACNTGNWSGYNMTGDGQHLSTLIKGWPRDVVYDQPGSLSKTSKRTNWQTTRACK